MRSRRLCAIAAALALGLAGGRPAAAGGFSFFEQGSKATGMAGAFVAQADDPTAVFYNPGGLALSKKKKLIAAGVSTDVLNESLYQGTTPGIGAGTTGRQDRSTLFQAHAYVTKAVGANGVVGVGVYQPFALKTAWSQPDSYAGREIALAAEIRAFDVNPVVSWKLGSTLGIGVGLVYRGSDLSLTRRVSSDNPSTGQPEDVASLAISTDLDRGVGWSLGVLDQLTPSFAWGISYRSRISIDYQGSGKLTQIATGDSQLDELIAATLPLGQELAVDSSIDFPETASLGLALAWTPSVTTELDVDYTGWSSFDRLVLTFPNNPEYTQTVRQEWSSSLTYRLGLQIKTSSGFDLRLGVAADKTPQPSRGVGAFYADADRTSVSAGIGRDWLDVAVMWTERAERTVGDSFDGLNGRYRGSSWLVGITVSK